MANVIIGMIGVILLIGLSITGYSYLGSNFMQARNSRSATITIASLRTMSDAIHAYRIVTRSVTPNTTMFVNNLIAAGDLKIAPVNPNRTDAPTVTTVAGAWPYPIYAGGPGNNAIFTTAVTSNDYIVMDLGSSTSANATCIGIQNAVGAGRLTTTATMDITASFASQTAIQPNSGCFAQSTGVPGASAGDYIAYIMG